jgi:hypothetical protein
VTQLAYVHLPSACLYLVQLHLALGFSTSPACSGNQTTLMRNASF